MPPRAPLPPPPPPVEIRSWPDREAMLADRAVVLRELVRMHMGPGRLGMLALWAAMAGFAWLLIGSAIMMVEGTYDILGVIVGIPILIAGLGLLVPAVVFVCLGLVRDREVRRLLVEWGALDRDPPRDRELRLPGVSLLWLLLSFALAASGLALCVIGPASARPGDDTYGLVAMTMGLGMVAWLTGLIGMVKASAHRRWVLRVLAAPAAVPAPGAPVRAPVGPGHR
ncbi:hypothetical protein [Streptomyces sp. cmx-18-6]|uniref:hypothetical protein n=1 Tax=Streptomyces sp. cmx-18-6 TaxID=2790930 RepID=UPI0039802F14